MTPLKTLIASIALAVGLLAICDTASAGGNHRHGYRHGPSINLSFGYPRYWGSGYWGGAGYWGGHGYWGPGYWGPGYWGPSAYYSSSPVFMVPQEPRVWVEAEQAGAVQPPLQSAPVDANVQQWWYWCASSRGYYPYVGSCAEGWQRVTPQPTPATR